jgi:tetratricopeptide (TPR) repeat protein
VKILFLAANPVDVVTRLRIDKELREISQKIRVSTHWHQLKLVSEWAVRAGDLQAALLQHEPDIVHFSGHCSQTSGIILEDEDGNRKIVSQKALCELFTILKKNIRVVVLNACYAKDQAQALTATIDFTIGMNAEIEDKDAIIFSAHFYQALAFGYSVKDSFDLAVNQLEIEGSSVAHVPELLVKAGANAAKSRIVAESHTPKEAEDISGPARKQKIAVADWVRPPRIPGENSNITIGEPIMRGVAEEKQKEKHRSVAFSPLMFASIAISLTIDFLRRFLGSDGGWPDIAATILQPVLIALAIIAAILTGISLLLPANPLVEKAARLGIFNGPFKAQRAVILTILAMVGAFGLWLSLPLFARYYNERGIRFQYREQPDLSRARDSYQRAVRLNPSYAQGHYNLALVEEDFQPEKAIEEYLLAIRHNSYIYPAYNNLARVYLRRGKDKDYESALNLLNQARDLSPQDENVQYSLYKNLGWANYLLANYLRAEQDLRRAISLRKDKAAAHCLLAYVLKEQGKAGVADECFDCVTLEPGEKDVEDKWVSDAQECLMKEDSQ